MAGCKMKPLSDAELDELEALVASDADMSDRATTTEALCSEGRAL